MKRKNKNSKNGGSNDKLKKQDLSETEEPPREQEKKVTPAVLDLQNFKPLLFLISKNFEQTLDEYEREQKKSSEDASRTEARKVCDDEFRGLQMLKNKVDDGEAIMIKAEKLQQKSKKPQPEAKVPKKVRFLASTLINIIFDRHLLRNMISGRHPVERSLLCSTKAYFFPGRWFFQWRRFPRPQPRQWQGCPERGEQRCSEGRRRRRLPRPGQQRRYWVLPPPAEWLRAPPTWTRLLRQRSPPGPCHEAHTCGGVPAATRLLCCGPRCRTGCSGSSRGRPRSGLVSFSDYSLVEDCGGR